MLLPLSLRDRLTLHARHSLKEARDIARYTKSESIELRHLLLALALEEGSIGSLLLDHLGFKKDTLGKYCLKKTPRTQQQKQSTDLHLSPAAQEIVKRAFVIASNYTYPYVGTEHLMSALLQSSDPFIATLYEAFDLTQEKVRSTIEAHLHYEQFPQMTRLFELGEETNNEPHSHSQTPLLDQYTTNLTQLAKDHPLSLVGREAELERLTRILSRKEKRNALLIGDPGVGKTALVTALAQRIATGIAGPVLHGRHVRSLDLALLVAGTSFRGEFETRLKELLKEVKREGHTILFIDEFHTIVGTGNIPGGLDVANILKPALARSEIQCIGATTQSEYKRHLEKDGALERRFQVIEMAEPTPSEALTILQSVAPHYAQHHGVNFDHDILQQAIDLSIRFIPDRFLPDKALDLIDEAGALVRRRMDSRVTTATLSRLEAQRTSMTKEQANLIETGRYEQALLLEKRLQALAQQLSRLRQSLYTPRSKSPHNSVHTHDLFMVLSRITRIPLERLAQTKPQDRLRRIKHSLTKDFIGQGGVRAAVVRLLTRSLSPIRDTTRPLGSLLFLGPTGVGKTHLAKLIAREFFDDERALIRLDMSEFMERHSTAQLLGAPAGYVGFGEGGKLTEAVRRQPASVILFDEIEKAHPDVANILLQILDEGHLTDAEGRRVSFKQALIIITSNIGTASFTKAAHIGFSARGGRQAVTEFEITKKQVLHELQETLRPELLARLDDILVFEPLNLKALEKIARRELEKLIERLSAQDIRLKCGTTLFNYIAKQAQMRGDGARSIRKFISEEIEYRIASELLKDPILKQLTLSLQDHVLSVRH